MLTLQTKKGALFAYTKVYNSRCPVDRPDNSFYLKPLLAPKGQVWYGKAALGHNTLQNTVPWLMKSANFTGFTA